MAQQSRAREETMEATKRTGTDPIVLASVASVALSWFYFYVRGERLKGIFVGLWPPTLLAFASYFRQQEMQESMKHGASGVVTRVQRMMQQ
ncbi:hypothetical protein [Halobacterium zhouii]|uniref:hypothetical protein n=1 Tax=Halobacterium zhouii TaxID=2902624 RepID=UPI001E59D8FA|nr:hypothetical protein [Halobacterium zhouii]